MVNLDIDFQKIPSRLFYFGLIKLMLGKFQDAAKIFQSGLSSRIWYIRLIECFLKMRNISKALNASMESDHSDGKARFLTGLLLILDSQFHFAVSYFDSSTISKHLRTRAKCYSDMAKEFQSNGMPTSVFEKLLDEITNSMSCAKSYKGLGNLSTADDGTTSKLILTIEDHIEPVKKITCESTEKHCLQDEPITNLEAKSLLLELPSDSKGRQICETKHVDDSEGLETQDGNLNNKVELTDLQDEILLKISGTRKRIITMKNENINLLRKIEKKIPTKYRQQLQEKYNQKKAEIDKFEIFLDDLEKDSNFISH